MSLDPKTRRLAKGLFKLSLEDGTVSQSRVTAVLAWVDRERPSQTSNLLREYLRLITIEVDRGQARVEHAGDLEPQALGQIATSFSRLYGRPIETTSVTNPDLIAGLRIRVGCDVYENSIASQLAQLETSTL